MAMSPNPARAALIAAIALLVPACQPPEQGVGMTSYAIQEIHPPDGNCGDLWYTWNGPWGSVPVRSNSGSCDITGTYGLQYECAELVDRFFLHNMFGDTPGQPQRIWANAGYDSCNYVWNNLRNYYDVYGPNYTHGGPEPVPGDALEWDNNAGSFHTALVVENYTDNSGQMWLGAIQQNAYWSAGTAWPTRNVKWNGTTFSSTWQNIWDGESVCWIHAKKNMTVAGCGAAGAACTKGSDCCDGESCENGKCVACPGASASACTANGCGGTASCAVSLEVGAPTRVAMTFFNETGATWTAASTTLGTVSGMGSPLASSSWKSSSVVMGAAGDTKASDAITFEVPLAVGGDGLTTASDKFTVLVDGKAVGVPMTVSVKSSGTGGLDAALDKIVPPGDASAGERVQATVELTNTGWMPWRAGKVGLGLVRSDGTMRDSSWPSGDQVVMVAQDVLPGKSATLAFWFALPDGAKGTMSAIVQLEDADLGPFGPAIEVPVGIGTPAGSSVQGGCALGNGRPISPSLALIVLALVALIARRRGGAARS
jgi:hypothetical protein